MTDEIPPVSELSGLTLWDRLRLEPVMVLALVEATLALVASFGLELTGEQTGALMAFAAIVVGLIARSRVVPVERIGTEIVSVEIVEDL